MKDIRTVHHKTRDSSSDWVAQGYYTSVIPILKQPAKSLDDIYGTAFQIKYGNTNYIVTAKHVVEIDNPSLFFQGTGRREIILKTKLFNKMGTNWIFHKTKDIAVLPFKIPEIHKRIINTTIQPNLTQVDIQPNQIVKHLGYPDKITGHWTDTKKSNTIPSGISGKVIQLTHDKIMIDTIAHKGDSGGPLFIKIGNIGKLVGLISKTKILKNDVTKQDEMYLGETTALPMSLVYDVIKKFEKDNP